MKLRKLSTSGNPGRSTARPAPPVWTASSRVGKITIGAASCGRRNVCLTERRPSASTTRTLATSLDTLILPRTLTAPQAQPRSRQAVASRPRGGIRSCRRRRRRGSARPARATRPGSRPRRAPARPWRRRWRRAPARPAGGPPSRAGSGRSRRRSLRARSAEPSASPISRCGLPTSAFSEVGVPSATIRPPAMIPTRLASWSASSRYWVVRKTVAPSRLSAETSSQIALRLTGSSPVVGSSRNSTRGSWTSAEARSSRRRMPPE